MIKKYTYEENSLILAFIPVGYLDCTSELRVYYYWSTRFCWISVFPKSDGHLNSATQIALKVLSI